MPVVDASIVLDLVAPDVPAGATARLLVEKLAAEGKDLTAPSMLWLETSNALLTSGYEPGLRTCRGYSAWPGPDRRDRAALSVAG